VLWASEGGDPWGCVDDWNGDWDAGPDDPTTVVLKLNSFDRRSSDYVWSTLAAVWFRVDRVCIIYWPRLRPAGVYDIHGPYETEGWTESGLNSWLEGLPAWEGTP